MRWLTANVDWRQVAGLGVVALAVLFLWDTPVIYPLKILVVFFHELSHALAAIVTGGSAHSIELSTNAGGLTWTSGGNRFVTASAGYLGSLLWGAAVLLYTARIRRDRIGAVILGVILVSVTVWLVRPVLGFGFVFGALTGVALIGAGSRLDNDANGLILKVVGLTSCLYALYDIKSDILDRPELRSDARTIAELTGVPTLLWGLIWLAIALAVAAVCVLVACKRRERRGVHGVPSSQTSS
jgi:hypothetical protein